MSWGWLGCRGWLRRQGRLGRLGQRLSVLSVLATRFLGGLSQAICYFIAALREGVYIKLQKPGTCRHRRGPGTQNLQFYVHPPRTPAHTPALPPAHTPALPPAHTPALPPAAPFPHPDPRKIHPVHKTAKTFRFWARPGQGAQSICSLVYRGTAMSPSAGQGSARGTMI